MAKRSTSAMASRSRPAAGAGNWLARWAGWMRARNSRLVGVDIADTRDNGLIEQHRLDRPGGAFEDQTPCRGVEGERLRAKPFVEKLIQRRGVREDVPTAESPLVAESELAAIVEGDDDMRVRFHRPPRRPRRQSASHAEMNQ